MVISEHHRKRQKKKKKKNTHTNIVMKINNEGSLEIERLTKRKSPVEPRFEQPQTAAF